MNVREVDARTMLCPLTKDRCIASGCMLWQWDEPLLEGPDSYISDPPPTGHCGLIQQEYTK